MGQIIALLVETERARYRQSKQDELQNDSSSQISTSNPDRFPDLGELPPEISLTILSNLNATDLCLASCVWQHLGNDEALWQALCKSSWPYCSAYKRSRDGEFSFRRIYLKLDEASLTFNGDGFEGLTYLFREKLVDDNPLEIARFMYGAKMLDIYQKNRVLERRPDVLNDLVLMTKFSNEFLPNALRKFFKEFGAPNARNDFLVRLIEKFSTQYVVNNPGVGLSQELVFLLSFSLIMLSVDLASPHVKNKMSKREFIRNTLQAAPAHNVLNADYLGHLYDNVYLMGHVAPHSER